MGGKPKAKDYEPSAEEKVSAAVGMAENKYFKENYDPLLKKMADDVATDDTDKILRGRANADVMQTLAGNASYDKAATAASGAATSTLSAFRRKFGSCFLPSAITAPCSSSSLRSAGG